MSTSMPSTAAAELRLRALRAHLCGGGSSSSSVSSVGGRVVAVLGAGGGIGQPLALLLKQNPRVADLRVYDVKNCKGVAADLSHIESPARVSGYTGEEEIGACLTGVEVVVIPAGVPRKPGMTRDDLFGINAGIVKSLAMSIAKYCPKALVLIISNPVNSTVPIACEVLKQQGVLDPCRVMGVTQLDLVRSNTFMAEHAGIDPRNIHVPVIGGHAGTTILPLLSRTTPAGITLSADEAVAMTKKIQTAGGKVVEAKAGGGSATLSMAYAGAKFADLCIRGLNGEPNVTACAYVMSGVTELPYFSSPIVLGPNGVAAIHGLGALNDFEQAGVAELIPVLKGQIDKGIAFANK